MSDDRHEAGIEAATQAIYDTVRTYKDASCAQMARDSIAAYKQAAGLVDRESLVAEIVALVRSYADVHMNRALADLIEHKYGAAASRPPQA